MSDPIVFHAPGYEHLAGGYDNYKFEQFPDGEISIRFDPIRTKIGGASVVLVGGCHDAQASETLLALAYEIAKFHPESLTVYITYFRNARSDRSVRGEAVMAKFQAELWSGLGTVFPNVRLIFVDLHNDNVLNYFHGPVRTSNVDRPIKERLVREVMGRRDFVLGTVDEGRVSEVRRLAQDYGWGFASIVKQRLSGSETKVLEVHGDVKGRRVAIIDDLVATGSSLVNAAKAYINRGAIEVEALATHGVFVGQACDILRDSPLKRITVTDSHPRALRAAEMLPDKINIVPLAEVLSFQT